MTNRIIVRIEHGKEYGVQKAAVLAALRNSIGKPFSEAEEVWPLLFYHLPPEFLSADGHETPEERAIYTALQMYAVCTQGSAGMVKSDPTYKGSIGRSLRSGRDPENPAALDRKFGALISSDTYEELTHHLRQILKTVKGHAGMTVSFPRLASDLLYFQRGSREKLYFRWAQEYFSYAKPADGQETEGRENKRNNTD